MGTFVTDIETSDGDFILNINMRVREFVEAILVDFVRILIFFNTVVAPMIGLDMKRKQNKLYICLTQ